MTQPVDHNIDDKVVASAKESSPSGNAKTWPRIALAALLLSVIVLISLYIQVANYGFYEDDYWATIPFLKAPVSQLVGHTVYEFHAWTQGRPLNHTVPMWFSRIGYRLGGVQGIYFLGYLVHCLNAFLLYLLLRKWVDNWSAILGGCLLILLPPDTTHLFLVHNAHLYTSLTYLLIALLVIRTRFWWLSYPIAGLSLLSYETAFLPFVVFPLFFTDRSRRILRWFTHFFICGLVVITIAMIRLHLSEGRALDAVSSPTETLWRMGSSLWIGPMTSLVTFGKAFTEALHDQSPFTLLFAGTVTILLIFADRLAPANGSLTPARSRSQPVILIFAGLVSWVFSYVLTVVNYPPNQITGRLTSTHLAGVFGLACAIAGILAFCRSFKAYRIRTGITIIISLIVGVFVLYDFRIQSGYAAAWTKEKRFWRSIVELCPDVTPKTRVILVGTEPRQNEFILSNSAEDVSMLGDIFASYPSPLFFHYNSMKTYADIRYEHGQVTWQPIVWDKRRQILDLDDLILLQATDESISRISELEIPEIPFPLKSKPSPSNGDISSRMRLTEFGRFLLNH